ncbi:somatostatin receptor type 4-like [Astyanax mexicanus]|uniref:somatostatin receptor type 4-like n=1 Tax=Astyanax mexicanus TaxID=7994 RepID=UPI0020CB232F|nr:somatostatin receptor type 4-like [Astyanax mexicanus]
MLWTVLAVICCLLGFPASMLVLRELRRRQRPSDFFTFNLTTSDTVFIVLIPFSVLNTNLWQTKVILWTDNFMDGLSLFSRPLFMSCICTECYFAVVHPIMYMTNRKVHTIRKVISVLIWLSTICFSLLKCFASDTLALVFNATPLFIALPVITFCDISVLQALKKTDPSGNTNIHPQKKQALYTIINSFIMTVFVYLPPVASFSLASLIPNALKCVAEPSAFCFSLTGCFIMPILYLDSVGKLNSLKELWRKYI